MASSSGLVYLGTLIENFSPALGAKSYTLKSKFWNLAIVADVQSAQDGVGEQAPAQPRLRPGLARPSDRCYEGTQE